MLMLLGAAPALLTFLIRLFVPESSRWEKERASGHTSGWAARDLVGVLAGAGACVGIIWLWAEDVAWLLRIAGTVVGLIFVTICYLFPVVRFLQRSGDSETAAVWWPTIRLMLLGACLSGVALLATWASIQWAPLWADQLSGGQPEAKAYTQVWSALGAIVGTILAAFLGDWVGRRLSYTLLCLAGLGSALLFFQTNDHFGPYFLATVCLAGACTASFYGWLPLYLPELFRTRVRATGQGFSFNFGRILAAVGALQTGALMNLFGGSYPKACSLMSLIYVVGVVIIWLAPETRGRPLPD
jgi:hypothetical protein